MNDSNVINVQLYSPQTKQKEIHEYCDDKHPCFFITVVSGRQAGKTTSAINQSMIWALSRANVVVWWVSPFNSQVLKVYKDYINVLGDGIKYVVEDNTGSNGNITIRFINGSRIEFKSAESGDALRGATVDYMIIDEAAQVKKETFDSILLPTLTTRGKKCLIMSTPKGKNWFYHSYLAGMKPDQKTHKSVKFTSYDNKKNKPETLDILKSQTSEAKWEQEYMGNFVDAGGVFQHVQELLCLAPMDPIEGMNYYAGIDVGMLKDYTVLVILSDKGDMVFMDRFTGLEVDEIVDRLAKNINRYNPVYSYIETNSQGLPVMQLLNKKAKNIQGWTTTEQSKQLIINQTIAAFSNKEIRLLKNEHIERELLAFTFTLSESGKVKYGAANSFHDDIVIATCIAWECFVKNRVGERYSFITSNDARGYIPNKDNIETPKYSIMFGNDEINSNESLDNY